MSEKQSEIPVILRNHFGRNKFAKDRTHSLAKGARTNSWALSDLSKSLSSNVEEQIRSQMDRLTAGKSRAESTSVESLRNWANAKNGCRLGELVATNVPVECTGVLCDHKMIPHLETRKGYSEQPKHMRWSAHGLTFGSVFAKVFRKSNNAGEYQAKEVSLFVACNNCLDIWVGPQQKGDRRSDTLWPFTAPPSRPNRQPGKGNNNRSKDKKDRKQFSEKKKNSRSRMSNDDKDNQSTSKSSTVVDTIAAAVTPTKWNGKPVDPWKRVTVTMLKVYAKASGLSTTGRKDTLITQVMDHMQSADPAAHRKILATLSEE